LKVTLDLPPAKVTWLREIEWLRDQLPESPTEISTGPVDAATVAKNLGMSPQWVRDHARELGGWRAGSGPKAHWRFDLATVQDGLNGLTSRPVTEMPRPAASRPRKTAPRVLQIKGRR
jgi:hypothetical protein